MVRSLSFVLLLGLAVLAGPRLLPAQGETPAVQPQDQFFSGTITALTDSSVTVTRTVLGKQSAVRTFSITPDTRIEGKPHLKSRVTVRFVTEEQGDRALHIIVRSTTPPKKQG